MRANVFSAYGHGWVLQGRGLAALAAHQAVSGHPDRLAVVAARRLRVADDPPREFDAKDIAAGTP